VPRLKHFDSTGTARFITFNSYRNQPSLTNDSAKAILARFLNQTRQKYGFRLLGYVFMPEHVHLVIHPIDGTPVGKVIREIKSLSARDWFRLHEPPAQDVTRVYWQKRCYDHNCRTAEVVREKIEYCHTNPVRRGLVNEPAEWKWSSYNWYSGRRDVPLQMDDYEF
jgi:putative transposase